MSNDRLFGSWLEGTKELQEKAYGHELPKTEIPDIVDWAKINHIAALAELQEALDEVSWKPWASAEFVNRESYIGELVDALHFIANMLVGVGCTDQELSVQYAEKMHRNYERMKKGYDGVSDKCSVCRRDFGDLKAHGIPCFEEIISGVQYCKGCRDLRINYVSKREGEFREV